MNDIPRKCATGKHEFDKNKKCRKCGYCLHRDWKYDNFEYGGATCQKCGYRDHNLGGLR